jgi:hypothetical protein
LVDVPGDLEHGFEVSDIPNVVRNVSPGDTLVTAVPLDVELN